MSAVPFPASAARRCGGRGQARPGGPGAKMFPGGGAAVFRERSLAARDERSESPACRTRRCGASWNAGMGSTQTRHAQMVSQDRTTTPAGKPGLRSPQSRRATASREQMPGGPSGEPAMYRARPPPPWSMAAAGGMSSLQAGPVPFFTGKPSDNCPATVTKPSPSRRATDSPIVVPPARCRTPNTRTCRPNLGISGPRTEEQFRAAPESSECLTCRLRQFMLCSAWSVPWLTAVQGIDPTAAIIVARRSDASSECRCQIAT